MTEKFYKAIVKKEFFDSHRICKYEVGKEITVVKQDEELSFVIGQGAYEPITEEFVEIKGDLKYETPKWDYLEFNDGDIRVVITGKSVDNVLNKYNEYEAQIRILKRENEELNKKLGALLLCAPQDKPDINKNECSNCRFFFVESMCRRYPPKYQPGRPNPDPFPCVASNSWCGEWKWKET